MLSPCPIGTRYRRPYAMQNDSELAGDGGLGLLDADAFWPAAHPKLSRLTIALHAEQDARGFEQVEPG
jgi:hypothetical protein